MHEDKKRRWLRMPSPAMLVACVALFVALGGTSYAATKIAANSVGSSQLKSNAVTSAKIKSGAVTTAKIKNGAVTTAKLPDAAVNAAKLADNAVTSAELANGAVSTAKFAAIPGARVRNSTTQSIPNASSTALTFNTADSNVGGVWDAAHPTRLTAPVAGTYLVTATVSWANDVTGVRDLRLLLNGSTALAIVSGGAAGGNTAPEQNVATTYHLSAGDYVEAFVYQNSGSPLESWNSANDAPVMTLNWIAP